MSGQSRQQFKSAVWIIFKNENDEILLIRRKNTGWRDGEYALPAGHIDPHETAIQACVHEAREEVGLEISTDDLKLVHVMQCEPVVKEDDNFINLYFSCERWGGVAIIGEPEKCDDLIWVASKDFDQIPVINTVRKAIEHIEHDESLSFYGF